MSSIIAQARQWLAEREPGRWEAYDDHGIVSLREPLTRPWPPT